MVRKLIAIILLLLANVTSALSQGVAYFNNKADVYEALNYAAKQKKLLIVECYAHWNYRSEWTNNVMNTSEIVANKLNQEFVVFQHNTQTTQGAAFANTYEVTDYPTLIVFNRNGDVIDKISKNMDPQEFVDYLDQLQFNVDGSAVWRLQQLLAAAEKNNPAEVQSLFENLKTRYLNNLHTKPFWTIFASDIITSYYTATLDFLIKNRSKFNETIGAETVSKRLSEIFQMALFQYLIEPSKVDTLIINDIENIVAQCELESEISSDLITMIRSRSNGNLNTYLLTFPKLRDKLSEDTGFTMVLTLSFVAEKGTKEQKNIAKKYIELQMRQSNIPAQIQSLQSLVTKF